jgi:hypothetical protein
MKQNEMMTELFHNGAVGRTDSRSHQVSISVFLSNSSPHRVWIANGKANILSSGKTISAQGNLGTHLGWLWSTILLLFLSERESLPILIKLLRARTRERDKPASVSRAREREKGKGTCFALARERERERDLKCALSSSLSSCFENESG